MEPAKFDEINQKPLPENDVEDHQSNQEVRRSSHTFLKFVVKKGVYYALAFFIAVSLTFLLPRLLPGNPVTTIIPPPSGGGSDIYQEEINALTQYFGLDQPLWVQFLTFWGNFFQGNFGYDLSQQYFLEPVSTIIATALPYTLVLVVPALFITFFLGNRVGGQIGFSKSKKNTILYYFFIGLQSAPFYWISLVVMDIFMVKLRLFPIIPSPDFNLENIGGLIQTGTIPFLTLVFCFTGGWVTGMRSMTIYEMNSGYVLYCEKLGFKQNTIRKMVQRNAILPQFTGLNLRFAELIGATFVLENVFAWHGLGYITTQAFISRDYTLIVGSFIVTILIILIGNFLIDIAYGFIDPRIKTGMEGA